MTDTILPASRRAEYARLTHQAILDAARKLFSERGYTATRVDEIATEARVAPATVYAVTGGKRGLLREVVRTWTEAPIVADTLTQIGEGNDPEEIIDTVAGTVREMREQFADVMRLVLTTAQQDDDVAEQAEQATATYRAAFVPVARRLAELAPEVDDVGHAVDVLWFYFGYSAFFTLHDDNGWSYARAERWLAAQAKRELLSPDARASTSPRS